MDRNQIDLSKIVFDTFKRVLEEDNILVIDEDSDTTLALVVNTYGWARASPFSSEQRPLLNITASLISNDRKVIWKQTGNITNREKSTDSYSFGQLSQDPEITAKSLEQATAILANQILSELRQ